ncbi:MAG TPA: leucyl aminopeptidase family protein [Bacteroidales bacterium]|nr:leucyl aminopeptidase family protein [Bacteroidales bacterium]
MIPSITVTTKEQELEHLVIVVSKLSKIPAAIFSAAEKKYLKDQVENHKKEVVSFNRLEYRIYVFIIKDEKDRPKRLESCRKTGDKIAGCLNDHKATRVAILDAEGLGEEVLAFAEGMTLGSYRFLKYKKERENENTLKDIEIYSKTIDSVDNLNILLHAVALCRDLVNEPNSHLTATGFAKAVGKMARESGATVEIMNKKKLETLKMGGLLGVNRGSHEPPTFTVMEWKPAKVVNRKPLIFVGKGVVYDTGGMNIKTGDYMLNMKDDMAGAAAVASAVYAIARARLPVHVVGLMPATDNRPGEKALVSGDIITMHNGMTVEVLNTDAEGRLILADALSYAKKYDPALVIDLATLTGSALRAVGHFAAAAMQAKAPKELETLESSGFDVCERLVEFPMWDEYGDLVKSDLADLKNSGPAEAGMITAGKFLEKFTGYPFIHLDIAGPAFLEKRDSYRGQGGTGFGVRLLWDFTNKLIYLHKTSIDGTTA